MDEAEAGLFVLSEELFCWVGGVAVAGGDLEAEFAEECRIGGGEGEDAIGWRVRRCGGGPFRGEEHVGEDLEIIGAVGLEDGVGIDMPGGDGSIERVGVGCGGDEGPFQVFEADPADAESL